jgi:hypothetical protein
MLTLLIALLISLGQFNTPEDWNNLSTQQQQEYVIIVDVISKSNP